VAQFGISNVIPFFDRVERLDVIDMKAGSWRKRKLIKTNNKKLIAE